VTVKGHRTIKGDGAGINQLNGQEEEIGYKY